MDETALKTQLIDKIEHADLNQLKEIYGLLINYFNGEQGDDWYSLSEYQKEKINKSIEQANAGLGTPAKEVIKLTREKYGLNG